MKVGDYGTGGREKRIYIRNRFGGTSLITCLAAVVSVVLIFFWVVSEITSYFQLKNLRQVKQNAIVLRFGEQGLYDISNGINDLNGKIVALTGVDVRPSKTLYDHEFDIEFNDVAQVQRIVEYCQWIEHTRTIEQVVGKTEDGKDIVEQTTDYYYLKDWRPHLIPSFYFKKSIAYHNPQRDPFPTYVKDAPAILGSYGRIGVPEGQLKVQIGIPGEVPRGLYTTGYGMQHGVYTHDGRWVYSKYQEDYTTSVMKAVGTFFFDGVVDLGIKGKCDAGDIRVSWMLRKFHPQMTIIGRFDRATSQVVPFSFSIGSPRILLSSPGMKSVDEIVYEETKGIKWGLWIVRFITLAFVGLSMSFCVCWWWHSKNRG